MGNLNYLGTIITNDARCEREIKTRIVMTQGAFNKTQLKRNGSHSDVFEDKIQGLHQSNISSLF